MNLLIMARSSAEGLTETGLSSPSVNFLQNSFTISAEIYIGVSP